MPPAYGFLLVGLLSFAAMGITHKLGDRYHAQPLGMAVFTMFTACLVSGLYTALFQEAAWRTLPGRAMLLALPFGAAAALGLWTFQSGLRHGNIATSWLLINLSSGVPTILSILFYHEPLSGRKLLVLLLVTISLLLLWWDRHRPARSVLEESR